MAVSSTTRVLDVTRHYVAHTIATRRFRIFLVISILFLIARTLSSYDVVHRQKTTTPPSPPPPASPDAGVAHIGSVSYWDELEKKWIKVSNSAEAGQPDQPRSNFAVVTWNIDFASDEVLNRVDAAISYLRSVLLTAAEEPDTISPAVILLQEVSNEAVTRLAENEWVQANYFLTDVTPAGGIWDKTGYGTVTLVDKRLNVQGVIRLHYDSDYYRDCLFVDIEGARTLNSDNVTIRVGNTHLESLVSRVPKRPAQLKLAASFILNDQSVYSGLIAGDMNPIEPFDANLPTEAGLKDAYLEGGGKEDSPRGHTWGYQTENNPYPKRRFDKILYAPGKIKIEQVEVIGIGEKTLQHPKVYVSDHFGVIGNVRIL